MAEEPPRGSYAIKYVCIYVRTYSMFTESRLNTRRVMQSRDVVEGLHNCLEFVQPCSCLDEAM